MRKIEWDEKQNDDSTIRPAGERQARATAGRRRCIKKHFRGPGRGKDDYVDGVNPVREAHGGSIPQGEG